MFDGFVCRYCTRFGSVSVRMYADDHRPPHFHIVAPDFHLLVRISDLTVIGGEARQNPDCRGSGMGASPSRDVGS